MKMLIGAVVLSLILLGIILCRRRKSDTAENDPATAKSRLRILVAACNEIWMFLYRHPRSGLDRLDAVEIQNVFDGILLSLTREDAFRLYEVVKQKLTQSEDVVQSSACSLIIRELSRRFGC